MTTIATLFNVATIGVVIFLLVVMRKRFLVLLIDWFLFSAAFLAANLLLGWSGVLISAEYVVLVWLAGIILLAVFEFIQMGAKHMTKSWGTTIW